MLREICGPNEERPQYVENAEGEEYLGKYLREVQNDYKLTNQEILLPETDFKNQIIESHLIENINRTNNTKGLIKKLQDNDNLIRNIRNPIYHLNPIYPVFDKTTEDYCIKGIINITKDDINKKIRVINSFEQAKKRYNYTIIDNESRYKNEEDIKNCEIRLNGQKYKFTYYFTDGRQTPWEQFGECFNLISLDLENFNCKNIINMAGMFFECKSLKELNLANLETKNVFDMNSMFFGCQSLKNLDLSFFNTQKVVNMSRLFFGCKSLISIKGSFNLTLLKRIDLEKPVHTKVTKKELSVEDRIVSIKDRFKSQKRIDFFDLFEVKSKEYVVVTFLAILEMAKNKELIIYQEDNFDNIVCEAL